MSTDPTDTSDTIDGSDTTDSSDTSATAASITRTTATDVISNREYDVPADAPTHDCPYCEAVLPTDELLDLHIGVEHEDEASEAELEAYEDTFERESNQVFIYHLKVISLVVAIYFVFLFTYSAIL